MNVTLAKLNGLFIIEPSIFNDERGYFYEPYNLNRFKENGISSDFVQDNQSYSSYGTLRGLHMQVGDFAQAKLVRCIQGRVLDVAVDLRPDSETYGKHFSIELTAENHKQLFVPRGFAHGFAVLSESAIFQYKVDNFYNKKSERGIIYNDSDLAIDWKLPISDVSISEKDKVLPSFKEFKATQ